MPTILESKDDYNQFILTDRERTLIYRLRVLLKDLPDDVLRTLNTLVEQQRGERWTDQMLLNYIYHSLGYINAAPLQTTYTLDNVPDSWISPILTGAMIFALFAETINLAGEQFSYSDNGISLSLSNAGNYQSAAQALFTSWDTQVKNLKAYLRPNSAMAYGGMNSAVRIRSYAPRMWNYR